MPRALIRGSMVTLALLLIWGGSWLDYREHAKEHLEEHRALTEALTNATQGAVMWLFRGGVYDPESLESALEDARRAVGAAHLRIVAPDGQQLARVVSEPSLPAAQIGLHIAEIEPPRPRGPGRGRPSQSALTKLPEGALRLELALSHAAVDRRLESDWRRLMWSGSILTASAILLFVLYGFRTRSLVLAGHLEVAREKLAGLEFLRRLGSGLAHETRNPLGIVRGFAQHLIAKAPDAEEVRDAAQTIVEQTDRTLARLDEFMLLSRPAELHRVPFDLHALLVELGALLGPDLEGKHASLELGSFDLHVEADREQVQRLFLNLLLNAVQAIGTEGVIQVSARRIDGATEVCIADDGPGIPPEIRATLFEPYVTRRAGGTGLGLAIARRIGEEHGWNLRCEIGDDGGTTFVVTIPSA